MKTKAELALLEAPWPPFDVGTGVATRNGVGCRRQQAAYDKFPGITSAQCVPPGLNEAEEEIWIHLMGEGLINRDPLAPRMPRALLETQAEQEGKTPHMLEFMLYGPEDVPYHPKLSIGDQYKLRADNKQLKKENDDRARNAQRAQRPDATGEGAGAAG